jgi:hypothetical protein
MQWISPFWSSIMTLIALIVAAIALFNCRTLSNRMRSLSAGVAVCSGKLLELERTERLTPSKLAELADVNDSIDKGLALLKRINSRETMRDRQRSSSQTSGNSRDADGLPDPYTEPDAWRKAMNARLGGFK